MLKEMICDICNTPVYHSRATYVDGRPYHSGDPKKFLDGFYKNHRRVTPFSHESELRDRNPEWEEKEMERYALTLPQDERPCASIARKLEKI